MISIFSETTCEGEEETDRTSEDQANEPLQIPEPVEELEP